MNVLAQASVIKALIECGHGNPLNRYFTFTLFVFL